MDMRMITTSGSMAIALLVATTTGVVEAGNGKGASDRSYGAGYRTTPAAEQAAGRAREQNRHQHQYRQREHNGSTNWTMESADSGKGQYSDDKYLSQKDFQAWLYQSLEQSGQQLQYQEDAESLAADGY